MLISSPSPPFLPTHSLTAHPILPSIAFPSFPVPVEGSQSHLPLPSISLASLFPFPGVFHPLNQLGSLEEHYKLPQWGLGQSPADKRFGAYLGQKEQLWWQQFFVHFIRINVIFCDFEAEGSIKFSLP